MKLTSIIKPAKATTPSMTNTLKRDKTSKSERSTPDKEVETKNKIKKVIISKSKRVMSNHSDNSRNANESTTQIENIPKKNVEGPAEQSTEM